MNGKESIRVLFTFSGEPGITTTEELDFPTTKEKLNQMLSSAEADGKTCIRMSPFFWGGKGTTPIGELTDFRFDEANVNEFNYLAAELSVLDADNLEKFEAVIQSGRHYGVNGTGNGELADYINVVLNLDSFTFYSGMSEEGYGEQLLAESNNDFDHILSIVRNGSRRGEDYARYIECLRESVDVERLGHSMAQYNDGEFIDNGYLIEDGSFNPQYFGVHDIPEQYRIREPSEPAFVKVENVDLCGLLMEMHAIGGNYTQDAAKNISVLYGGGEYFITENKGKLSVLSASEVFCKDSPENAAFLVDYEQDAHAYFALAYNFDGSRLLHSSLYEVDINEMKNDVARLSYGAVSVDVEFKDGTNSSLTLDEWSRLSDAERECASGMIYRYDPYAESTAKAFLNNLRKNIVPKHREITQEEFLAKINAPFMARARNAQPNMFRVAREAASDMAARDDAEVYRLLPEGALKISPMDVVKSNGLWFKEHREFAIKPEGLAGLRNWANRTADDIMRQAARCELSKSHRQEH